MGSVATARVERCDCARLECYAKPNPPNVR